jgi:muconolactone delta-isomerase
VSAPTVVTTPVVVTPQPVATVQSVWVEGRYVDQVQANGTLLRVWQPGHYEQRTLVVP